MKFRKSFVSIAAMLLVVGIGNAANDFYSHTSGAPATGSQASSATMRAEFDAIVTGFDKLPTLTANGDKPVFVNAAGTALTATTASSARTLLGLVIGTNVQAYDAELATLAALTSAADQVPFWTGPGAASQTTFTGVARTLIAQGTQALMRTTGLGATATGDALFTAASAAAARSTLGYVTGTFTTASLASANEEEITVTHGLGTDNVDFGCTVFGSLTLSGGSLAVSATMMGTDKRTFMMAPVLSATPTIITEPSAGTIKVRARNSYASSAQVVTVHWWIRARP